MNHNGRPLSGISVSGGAANVTQKSYDHLVKFIVIGDSTVGKTSLINRFHGEQFSTSLISTIGVDFRLKTIDVDGKRIKIQVWDTAGQEQFQSITPAYYKGAHGVMLVYDVTNRRSFDNISRWMRMIAEHGNEMVRKVILANKCDVTGPERVIDRQMGEEIAYKNDFKFFETSAKENINIDNAVASLARSVLDHFPTFQKHGPNGLAAGGGCGGGAGDRSSVIHLGRHRKGTQHKKGCNC